MQAKFMIAAAWNRCGATIAGIPLEEAFLADPSDATLAAARSFAEDVESGLS
jgi:hypothetical protein